MNNITVQEIVQQSLKNKPVNVRQVKSFADENYKEVGISVKAINQFLYNESYNCEAKLYSSCETFEKLIE
jgi:hypothetical protein